MPNADVFTSRDLPVLTYVSERIDAGEYVNAREVATALNIEQDEAERALVSLCRNNLVSGQRLANGNLQFVSDVTPRAYQLTGLYPNPDDAQAELMAAIARAIEGTDDEDERTRLERFREATKDIGSQTVAAMLAATFQALVLGQ